MGNQLNSFITQLKSVAGDYDLMSQGLFEVANTLTEIPDYKVDGRLYSLARVAQGRAVDLRNLAARTAEGKNIPFYLDMASEMSISVEEARDWLIITVPATLPNSRKHETADFILHPLRCAVIDFQSRTPVERFEDCVICIEHQYDEALGTARVRDYDNIETKRFLDVIEAGFLTNDSGLMCSVYQTSKIGIMDRTCFYLMHPSKLKKWLDCH